MTAATQQKQIVPLAFPKNKLTIYFPTASLSPPIKSGDTVFEVDEDHGIVTHKIEGEIIWFARSQATDDNGNSWTDFWDSNDTTPMYFTREKAEAALRKEKQC